MATTTSTQPPAPAPIPVGFALGYAVFGAPAAWSLQLLTGYALASHACYPNSIPLSQPIWSFLWWVLIGVDFAALIAAGLAGWLAVAKWRIYRYAGWSQIGERRNRFLAQWALMTSILFSMVIIFTIIMLFIVPACDV
ncbi:MAG TPA: hypothetical protein VFL97_09790 [Nitrococcus sp.]|nr:hypothetical protein [Nitrococcus sp.]